MEQSANTFETLVPRKRSSSSVWVVIILVIVLFVVGWWWLGKGKTSELFTGSANNYQAVFLTNNQVYFGKLTEQRSGYAVLTDIFYLQVSQPLQPSQPNPNVTLVKLGNELHGPADRMEINRDQILFIETLDSTPVGVEGGGGPKSQVLRAILKYKADNKLK